MFFYVLFGLIKEVFDFCLLCFVICSWFYWNWLRFNGLWVPWNGELLPVLKPVMKPLVENFCVSSNDRPSLASLKDSYKLVDWHSMDISSCFDLPLMSLCITNFPVWPSFSLQSEDIFELYFPAFNPWPLKKLVLFLAYVFIRLRSSERSLGLEGFVSLLAYHKWPLPGRLFSACSAFSLRCLCAYCLSRCLW